jgi:DNA-binding winged helix-turn-helix (wHTH) protein
VNESSSGARVVRFGVFEVDLRTAELRKQGARIRLPGQSFQVLEALLLRPGELVTREELRQKLWPSDSFGDFEHGLNAAVNRVRDALGDSSNNPRFVETLPRRGYRFIAPVQREADGAVKSPAAEREEAADPDAAVPPSVDGRVRQSVRRHWLWFALAAIAVLVIAMLTTWWRIPPAIPVMESVVQLTDDGQPKGAMSSDGSRIYFNEGTDFSSKIAQVSVHGGPTAPVEMRVARPFLAGISRDGSALLVVAKPTGWPFYGGPLWWVPLPAGEPRRLGSFDARYADIFPDGQIVFGQSIQGKDPKGTDRRADYFITDKDGSNPQKLRSFPGCDSPNCHPSAEGTCV